MPELTSVTLGDGRRLAWAEYGEQVPVGMGRYLAEQIPGAELIEVDDGGHLSTINNHIADILGWLSVTTGPADSP